jgi:hypothetical protein
VLPLSQELGILSGRLDGNDRLRRGLLVAQIVERSSGNIPKHHHDRGDLARGQERRCFGLFLQTRQMAEEKVASTTPPKSFVSFDDLGKLLALLGAALLALSVAYDYFFLLALGLSFDSVATVISDHVRSAIVWLPKAAIFGFAYLVYELLMRRIEGGRSEEELIRTSPTPRFTKWFRWSANVMFVVIGIFIVVTGTLLSTSLQGVFLGAMLVWAFLSLSVVQHPRLGASFSTSGARVFIIVPLAVIYVASFGYGSAREMLTRTTPSWELTTKDASGIVQRKVNGIRAFSASTIVVDTDKRVFVLPADSVVNLANLPTRSQEMLNACAWFNVLCPSDVRAPKPKPPN